MTMVDAWVATAAKSKLVRQQIELGPLGAEEVEVQVEHCGLCHSDLSMLNNDWGFSQFPAVLGHEVVGRVVEVGPAAKGLNGRAARRDRLDGRQLHALPAVHVGRSAPLCRKRRHHRRPRGGFASRVRAHWAWTIPLPEKAQFRRGRPAAVRRHHRLQSAGDVRQADQPRRHRRHRRPGPHGREVRRRLWLRRDGLHLQREQVRRGPRIRRPPRRFEPRLGRDQETGRDIRPADCHCRMPRSTGTR